VNLTDYLDTGLFLDTRPVRALLRELAGGKRFLNLFCYTGTATVHAAAGGAAATVSVDLSNTYLAWARRNLEVNGFRGRAHELERADCREWLRRERRRFDLVYLDPRPSRPRRRCGAPSTCSATTGSSSATPCTCSPRGEPSSSAPTCAASASTGGGGRARVRGDHPPDDPPRLRGQSRIHRCWLLRAPDAAPGRPGAKTRRVRERT